jgi:bifunctional non-homologous end joining protein LigD
MAGQSGSPATKLPAPMLAVADTVLPDEGDRWAYEMKWDGYRAIVGVEGGRLRIVSRRGNDVTTKFPELDGLPEALGSLDVVLDGELVVLDDDGIPSFQAIQEHTRAAALMCFDVLRADGRDLMPLPWRDRRAVLERLGLAGDRWQTPSVVIGDAKRAWDAAERLRMEGVVAKLVDSPYRPGRRSSEWRKVRRTVRQELVVGGWLPGEGRLAATMGSLLVGYHEAPGGPLHYAGRVGTGFTDRTREAVVRSLRPRDTSPFADAPRLRTAAWVEPETVVEVRFTEWTREGILRQPVFLGVRDDKEAVDVVRET